MTSAARGWAAPLLAVLLTPTAVPPAAAQATVCVAVVVVDQTGATDRDCAEVQPGADGVAILEAAGHAVRVEGGFVCAIDGHPAAPECGDDPSAGGYWGYFHGDGSSGWSYSIYGAEHHRAEEGDVEGWRWQTDGDAGTARKAPPATRFEDVCAEEPAPTPTDEDLRTVEPEPAPPADRSPGPGGDGDASRPLATEPDGGGTPSVEPARGVTDSPTPGGAKAPTATLERGRPPTPSPSPSVAVSAQGRGPGGTLAAVLIAAAIVAGGALLARRRVA